jgi:hypothetical protein
MTTKSKKQNGKSYARSRRKLATLRASVEDDWLLLADRETGAEARWNRPRKVYAARQLK